MLSRLLLWLLTPFRQGAVRWRRGSLPRSACIALLKPLSRRPGLLAGLSEVRPCDRPDLSFELSDSMVVRSVYWFGVQGYEGILAKTWADLCAQSSDVLEVGGNVGFYTVVGGKAARGKYTVVEPVPEIAAVLQANLVRNGLSGPRVLQSAVIPGLDDQPVQLSVPDEGTVNPVGAHLLAGGEVTGRTSHRVITVPGLAFARLVQHKDLVKIDAEGIENALLASALSEIEAGRPTLLIELLPESWRLAQLLQGLAQRCGYFLHVVPAYGSNQILVVPAESFSAAVPQRYKSKDVILSMRMLPGAIRV